MYNYIVDNAVLQCIVYSRSIAVEIELYNDCKFFTCLCVVSVSVYVGPYLVNYLYMNYVSVKISCGLKS